MAELFVDLWLRADAADPDSSVAAAVRSLSSKVELPRRSRTGGAPAPARVMAVRSTATPEMWTVVVAVLHDQAVPAPDGGPKTKVPPVRYFAVSGSGVKDGGPVTIGGPPAEVAAPGAAAEPASPFTHPIPHDSALETSLGEFLRTYLSGGQGAGLERYLSPGLRVSAPAVAPYVRVDVEDVVADAAVAMGKGVAADGSKARVEVRVTGEDKHGARWPLMYRAEVSARAGRWEVSALEAGVTAPAPNAISTATSSPAPVSGGVR
ncbi:conjugal transfer protein [Streptomyces sp. NPDC002044]|uniref:conjugal transfer protein n=1 Tax=Streptomyces sp. NPDC002044 TaxID=3154662 RepID=UPI003325CE97